MEENFHKEEGVNLLDILRLLLSKIKLLLLVVLVGGIVGGTFAAVTSYDTNYWGTTIEFYVNPEKPKQTAGEGSQYGVYGAYGRHVMDNMVKLLESESFSEQLMLNGHDLPYGYYLKNTDGSDNVELIALVNNAQPMIDAYKSAQIIANEENADMLSLYAVLEKEWANVSNKIFTEYDYNEYVKRVSEPAGSLTQAYKDYKEQKAISDAASLAADAAYTAAYKDTVVDGETVLSPVNKVLTLWRTTTFYKYDLNFHTSAVSYSYLESTDILSDANNLARSFIYVTISYCSDQKDVPPAVVTQLREKILNVVPAYIEENMAVPSDYEGTKCQRITRTDDIHRTNPGYTTTQAIKYALLVGAASLVVACIVIVIIDRSDKRLRDPDTIIKKFNVPVLSIVPTIADIEAYKAIQAKNRKKAKKHSSKTEVK